MSVHCEVSDREVLRIGRQGFINILSDQRYVYLQFDIILLSYSLHIY